MNEENGIQRIIEANRRFHLISCSIMFSISGIWAYTIINNDVKIMFIFSFIFALIFGLAAVYTIFRRK